MELPPAEQETERSRMGGSRVPEGGFGQAWWETRLRQPKTTGYMQGKVQAYGLHLVVTSRKMVQIHKPLTHKPHIQKALKIWLCLRFGPKSFNKPWPRLTQDYLLFIFTPFSVNVYTFVQEVFVCLIRKGCPRVCWGCWVIHNIYTIGTF